MFVAYSFMPVHAARPWPLLRSLPPHCCSLDVQAPIQQKRRRSSHAMHGCHTFGKGVKIGPI